MAINHTRLDKFIAQKLNISRRSVRLMLAQKRVLVDDVVAEDIDQVIHHFSVVLIDGEVIQRNIPVYIMLHKPVGVVSATKDDKHRTVIDLLKSEYTSDVVESLHIVGRLDLNTSGLVLLTNDSRWSSRITSPEQKVPKLYRVTLENELNADYITAFEQGMYFAYENLTTQPAELSIESPNIALVNLIEGRYHQIKRMFGRFRNPVVALHRLSIGNLALDSKLKAGESRVLTTEEVTDI